ncbi:hypothetical protein ACVJBD_007407 [Rhizobium mongolense]
MSSHCSWPVADALPLASNRFAIWPRVQHRAADIFLREVFRPPISCLARGDWAPTGRSGETLDRNRKEQLFQLDSFCRTLADKDGRRSAPFPSYCDDDGRADLKAVVQHMAKPLEVAPKGRTIIAGGFLLTVSDSVSAPTSCRHPTWTYTGLVCRICDTVQFRLPLAFLTLKQLKSSHKSTSSA